MKQNNESITPLRKYIAIGYAVIALLIGGIVIIYLREWRELERIEAEQILLLNGFMKKSTKDYKKEIQKAEQILNSLQQ